MNRTDRLVAIVMYLQGRRLVRADELAERFEISVRTVYRDMSALSEAGVPIAGEAGVGYSLVKGYHLPPVMLTADEIAALFVGAEMVKHFTDASLQGPVTSALEKLRAALPRDRQDHVERLARYTVVTDHRRHSRQTSTAQPWLLAVQQAVTQHRVLQLTYRGRNRETDTTRAVEPLGVVFYAGAWYLVAQCRLRCALRHFRVDRIRTLEATAETFPPPEDFSLAAHLEESVARTETIPARVWISAPAQERARRESYATLVTEMERDGGTEFSLFTYSLEWLAHWIVSFGGEAEAVAPDELREQVRTQIGRIADLHRATLLT